MGRPSASAAAVAAATLGGILLFSRAWNLSCTHQLKVGIALRHTARVYELLSRAEPSNVSQYISTYCEPIAIFR